MANKKEEVKSSEFWEDFGGLIATVIFLTLIGGCSYFYNEAGEEQRTKDHARFDKELVEMKLLSKQKDLEIEKELNFYKAPHQLRKMFTNNRKVTESTPAHGDFFLFSGSFTGGSEKTYIVDEVRFAWEIQDNTYIITTLPLEKVRIQLKKNSSSPSISWVLGTPQKIKGCGEHIPDCGPPCTEVVGEGDLNAFRDHLNPDAVIDKFTNYVVITVNENDWPTNVNLPMNKSGK